MKKLIPLFVLFAVLWSCSSDDDGAPPSFEAFSLKTYQPSAMNPEVQEFETGELVWSFDFANQKVVVEVALGATSIRLDPGTYDYTLNDNVCNYDDNRYFHVGSDAIGLLIMDNYASGVVVISDGCIDGPIFTFERD